MAVTRTWRVYGRDGHRQKESFRPSYVYDFTDSYYHRGETMVIDVKNSDKTGTNDYTEVSITADTAEACERELWGQISDGIFENSRVGKVEEVCINE